MVQPLREPPAAASMETGTVHPFGAAARGRTHADWSSLMVRAQDGDQAAYLALLTAIAPYLRVLARRGGIGADDVEDVVQDILLTIHSVRHAYDPRRPFGPWLVAVAKHRIADRMRRAYRAAARETALTPAHETFAAEATNLYENAGERRQLHAAIARLPTGQRQAIELLRLKELSLKEASCVSGLSIAALKVAAHRAVKRLRSLLGEDSIGDGSDRRPHQVLGKARDSGSAPAASPRLRARLDRFR